MCITNAVARRTAGYSPRQIRTALSIFFERGGGDLPGRRAGKAAGVERAQLEAKKNRLHRQAALGCRDADVGRIIARDVLAFGADDDGHDQWQAIDGVG